MGAARQALPGLIEAAERDRRAVERIETHEIGAINHRIEQARLEDRRLDLIAREDPGRDLSRERAAGRKAAAEQNPRLRQQYLEQAQQLQKQALDIKKQQAEEAAQAQAGAAASPGTSGS